MTGIVLVGWLQLASNVFKICHILGNYNYLTNRTWGHVKKYGIFFTTAHDAIALATKTGREQRTSRMSWFPGGGFSFDGQNSWLESLFRTMTEHRVLPCSVLDAWVRGKGPAPTEENADPVGAWRTWRSTKTLDCPPTKEWPRHLLQFFWTDRSRAWHVPTCAKFGKACQAQTFSPTLQSRNQGNRLATTTDKCIDRSTGNLLLTAFLIFRSSSQKMLHSGTKATRWIDFATSTKWVLSADR